MKSSYKLSLFSLVGLFLFSLGYIAALYTISPQDQPKTPLKSPTASPRSQYIVDIPAKYFDPDKVYEGDKYILLGGNLEITNPPVAIDQPTNIEVVNEEYNPKEELLVATDIGPDIYAKDIDNDGIFEQNIKDGESIDVDNDGKKEKVIYGSVGMTHQPHKAVIVKNDRIIYKSEVLMNINLFESKSNNGFYLGETFNIGSFPMSGGRRITRFIYQDGEFIPVWYREIFDLQTTKP